LDSFQPRLSYKNFLSRFFLQSPPEPVWERAERYRRLMQEKGYKSIRELARAVGEDHSRVARVLKVLDLPEAVLAELRKHSTNARNRFSRRKHFGRWSVNHKPTLVPAALFSAVLDWRGGGGLKSVLHAHEDLAVEVDVPDGNILVDIDNPADYARVMERFRRREASPGK